MWPLSSSVSAFGETMSRSWKALLAALSLLCVGVAQSNPVRTFDIAGFDDMSCGAWVASERNPVARAHYLTWFRGFISGHNFANPDHQIPSSQIPSPETITLYVDRHCEQDPLSDVAMAVFNLVGQLSSRR